MGRFALCFLGDFDTKDVVLAGDRQRQQLSRISGGQLAPRRRARQWQRTDVRLSGNSFYEYVGVPP
jgi:hypothetical protein